jgi:hypothetical protein
MARQLLYFLVLALLTLLVYSNHFDNSFHFDDIHTIVNNVRVHSLSDPLLFFRDPAAFSVLTTHQVFRPLVSLSLAADYALAGGANPRWFHLSTFAWFLVLVGVLRALFGRRLGSSGWAWLATAIFAFHPVCAETVNYIVQRGDLYATLGVVLALWTYAAFPRHRRYGFYLIPFVAGALAKTTALTFPVLLAWDSFVYERAGWKVAFRRTIPAVAVAVIIGAWAATMTGAAFNPGSDSPGRYRATQFYVTLDYFGSFFLPLGLTADTDMRPVTSFADPRVALGIIFIAALYAVITAAMRRPPWRDVAFGLGWFLIALFPTAIVALAEVANDHRMFMAFPGLCLAAARVARNLLEPRMAASSAVRYGAVAAAIGILSAAGYGAHRRNEVWRTEESLWRDVTVKSPANGRGLMNYGLALMAVDACLVLRPERALVEHRVQLRESARAPLQCFPERSRMKNRQNRHRIVENRKSPPVVPCRGQDDPRRLQSAGREDQFTRSEYARSSADPRRLQLDSALGLAKPARNPSRDVFDGAGSAQLINSHRRVVGSRISGLYELESPVGIGRTAAVRFAEYRQSRSSQSHAAPVHPGPLRFVRRENGCAVARNSQRRLQRRFLAELLRQIVGRAADSGVT